MKRSYTRFVVVIHVAVLQGIYYFPQLPAAVASHFNAAGAADRWLSKPLFLAVRLGLTVGISLLFAVLPLGIARLPAAWIKLPRADYWLTSQRREQTCREIRKRLLEFGTFTLLVLIVSFQLLIQANLTPSHRFPVAAFQGLLMVYVVVAVAWALQFCWFFARTDRSVTLGKPESS